MFVSLSQAYVDFVDWYYNSRLFLSMVVNVHTRAFRLQPKRKSLE